MEGPHLLAAARYIALNPVVRKALVQIAATNKKTLPLAAVETSSTKHRVPNLRRRLALNAQTSQCELSLPDAMQ